MRPPDHNVAALTKGAILSGANETVSGKIIDPGMFFCLVPGTDQRLYPIGDIDFLNICFKINPAFDKRFYFYNIRLFYKGCVTLEMIYKNIFSIIS
jgi:hypothetical protein